MGIHFIQEKLNVQHSLYYFISLHAVSKLMSGVSSVYRSAVDGSLDCVIDSFIAGFSLALRRSLTVNAKNPYNAYIMSAVSAILCNPA